MNGNSGSCNSNNNRRNKWKTSTIPYYCHYAKLYNSYIVSLKKLTSSSSSDFYIAKGQKTNHKKNAAATTFLLNKFTFQQTKNTSVGKDIMNTIVEL